MKRFPMFLAALMALIVSFVSFSQVALAQPGPPSGAGLQCVEQSQYDALKAKYDECNTARESTAPCANLEEISRQLEEAKKARDEERAGRLKCEGKLPQTAKPAVPFSLVCDEKTTTKVMTGTNTYKCECIDATRVKLDLIEPTKKTVACVPVEDYNARLQEIANALLNLQNTKADKSELEKLRQQLTELNDRQLTDHVLIVSFGPRLDKVEQDVDDLKRVVRKTVNIHAGAFVDAGWRGNPNITVGGDFAIDGRFNGGRVGLIGMVHAGGAFESNIDTMLRIGAMMGPIFDLTESGSVRLFVGPELTQWVSPRLGANGIPGNFRGGGYGVMAGLPLRLGDAPLELVPYLVLEGGPANLVSDRGHAMQGDAFAFRGGLQLNFVTGWGDSK